MKHCHTAFHVAYPFILLLFHTVFSLRVNYQHSLLVGYKINDSYLKGERAKISILINVCLVTIFFFIYY